jgi:hypothetical protein
MKKITAIWAVVLIIIILGGAYWYATSRTRPSQTPQQPSSTGISVSGAAGLNGSTNQGNLGQPDSGVPQQPGQ